MTGDELVHIGLWLTWSLRTHTVTTWDPERDGREKVVNEREPREGLKEASTGASTCATLGPGEIQ